MIPYSTAMIDSLETVGHNIAQNLDLNKLLTTFQMDRPKSVRNIPKWNLSVLLNELTLKDVEMKYVKQPSC